MGERSTPHVATRLLHALLAAVLVGALALSLAGCGDPEPTQRAAFIAFLKERILDKPGMNVPVPTDDETKSFGPYAAQFAVIARFNHQMDDDFAFGAIGKFSSFNQRVRSIADLVPHEGEIANLRQALAARPMAAELGDHESGP